MTIMKFVNGQKYVFTMAQGYENENRCVKFGLFKEQDTEVPEVPDYDYSSTPDEPNIPRDDGYNIEVMVTDVFTIGGYLGIEAIAPVSGTMLGDNEDVWLNPDDDPEIVIDVWPTKPDHEIYDNKEIVLRIEGSDGSDEMIGGPATEAQTFYVNLWDYASPAGYVYVNVNMQSVN